MGSELPVKHFSKIRTVELPRKAEHMDEDTLYVMIKPSSSIISFYCPCGCRDIVDLKLGLDADSWSLHYDTGVTLNPSVQLQHGCKSHFWLRNNQVEWT